MAEKGFGVKEVNLIGASGTPTITSPNNLNLNAVNVAISTNATVGGTLSVTGNVSVGGTLTYEDVTNIDSVGVVTARNGVVVVGRGVSIAAGGLNVTAGISTLSGIVKIMSGLDIQTNGTLDIIGSSSSSGLDIQSNASVQIGQNGFPNRDYATFTDTGVNLNYSGSTKLATSNTGVTVTGTVAATAFSGSGASLTSLPAANLTGTLPAISGANLTGIAVTEAPVVDYTITANGSSAYRFHGGGVDETADDPTLYLIRGQKYRFNNTTGSSHPFALRVSSGGSAYTDGVTGSQNGIQFFTVPYAAPSSLVYQCTVHSGMVGSIVIRGGSSTAAISNNADNRVITGGTDGNLNGESGLTFSSDRLILTNTSSPQIRINNDTSDGSSTRFVIGKATGSNNFFNGAVAGDSCIGFPGDLLFGVGSAIKVRIDANAINVYGSDNGSGRVLPAVDNGGYIGESVHRWIAIYAVNGSIQTSDKNEKNTIVESDLGLSFVNKLKPVSYKWNAEHLGNKTHYGLIAQDIEEAIISEGKTLEDFAAVSKDDGAPMSLGYSELIAPLIKAVQDLSAKNDALEARISALEGS